MNPGRTGLPEPREPDERREPDEPVNRLKSVNQMNRVNRYDAIYMNRVNRYFREVSILKAMMLGAFTHVCVSLSHCMVIRRISCHKRTTRCTRYRTRTARTEIGLNWNQTNRALELKLA